MKAVLIEPGLVRTGFESVASGSLAVDRNGSYQELRRHADAMMRRSYSSRSAVDAEVVATVIGHAVEAARPRSRYLVTPMARLLVHTRRLAGDRVWDALMRRTYHLR